MKEDKKPFKAARFARERLDLGASRLALGCSPPRTSHRSPRPTRSDQIPPNPTKSDFLFSRMPAGDRLTTGECGLAFCVRVLFTAPRPSGLVPSIRRAPRRPSSGPRRRFAFAPFAVLCVSPDSPQWQVRKATVSYGNPWKPIAINSNHFSRPTASRSLTSKSLGKPDAAARPGASRLAVHRSCRAAPAVTHPVQEHESHESRCTGRAK